MPKKIWIRPKLIVLTRSTPEESSLIFCKQELGGPSGPQTEHAAKCRVVTPVCYVGCNELGYS